MANKIHSIKIGQVKYPIYGEGLLLSDIEGVDYNSYVQHVLVTDKKTGNAKAGVSYLKIHGNNNTNHPELVMSGDINVEQDLYVNGNVDIGGVDKYVCVGTGASQVNVGDSASQVDVGDSATTVCVGDEASGIYVGDRAASINIGSEAYNVYIGGDDTNVYIRSYSPSADNVSEVHVGDGYIQSSVTSEMGGDDYSSVMIEENSINMSSGDSINLNGRHSISMYCEGPDGGDQSATLSISPDGFSAVNNAVNCDISDSINISIPEGNTGYNSSDINISRNSITAALSHSDGGGSSSIKYESVGHADNRQNDQLTLNNVNVRVNDGTITGNLIGNATSAGKATKLATKRSLWGNDFDGTANVDGAITIKNGANLTLQSPSDAQTDPGDIVFTGFGGDELCRLYKDPHDSKMLMRFGETGTSYTMLHSGNSYINNENRTVTINNQSIVIPGEAGTVTIPTHYGLTLQSGAFTPVTYNPTGSAATVNIPTKLSQLTDDVVAGNYLQSTIYGNFDADTLFNDGFQSGYMLHLPSGLPYGIVHTLSYRGGSNNAKPDFASQIFIPSGDDSTSPNDMFFRTSLADSWNGWNKVITDKNISNYALPITGGTINTAATTPLNIKNTQSNPIDVGISFMYNNDLKGWIGYETQRGTVLYTYNGSHRLGIKDDGTAYVDSNTLIHSGNIGNYKSGDSAKLDGYLPSSIYVGVRGSIKSSDDLSVLAPGGYYVGAAVNSTNPLPTDYASLSVLGNDYYSSQLCVKHDSTRAWIRGTYPSRKEVSNWHEVAFTDSNVASATKLQTPRKLWGNDFDGTADVSGNLFSDIWRIIKDSNWNGTFIQSANYDGTSELGNIYMTGMHGNKLISFNVWANNSKFSDNVTVAGNVGIGNTSPTERLDVSGNIKASGTIKAPTFVVSGSAHSATLTMENSSLKIDKELQLTAGGSADICSGIACALKTDRLQVKNLISENIILGNSANGSFSNMSFNIKKYGSIASQAPATLTTLLTVNTTGNVGIGVDNPTEKLDVNGNVKIGGDLTINGQPQFYKDGNSTVVFGPNKGAQRYWFGVNTDGNLFVTDNGYSNTYNIIHSGNIGSQSVNYATWAGTTNKCIGAYTSNGGEQYPSYVENSTIKWNMMRNTTTYYDKQLYNGYCDWMLMDSYGGSDVPYVTGIGVLKDDATRAFIMSGAKGTNNKWKIKELATLDSNVASATKLQTARTLWGQSFDGTADVNGIATISGSDKDLYWRCEGSQYELKFGIGNGNVNRGIYDGTLDHWWIRRASTADTYIEYGNVGIGNESPTEKLDVTGNVKANGFIKSGSSDSYMLLGGGGHKSLSDFSKASWKSFTPAETALTNDDVLSTTGEFSLVKGTWYYAGNGYLPAGEFGNIDLAGCSVLTFGGKSGGAYTQLFITSPAPMGSNAVKANEILFYNNHGEGYNPGWTRVLTNRNYTEYITDTNYYHTRSYSSGLQISTGTGVSNMYVPYATASQAGVVSTGSQTFAGDKTFNSKVTVNNDFVAAGKENHHVYVDDGSNQLGMYIHADAGGGSYTQLYTYLDGDGTDLTVGYDEVTINTSLRVFDDVHAYSFYQNSDERLKTFGDKFEVDFEKLAKLRKSYFTFNNTPDKTHIGVSAQEVQKICPEIVNTDKDGYLSVDYSKLSVVALTAVDELYKKNIELENRLAKIEAMLAKINIE